MSSIIEAIKNQYQNTKSQVQLHQIVALIFKNIKNQPLSILYLQRNYHENDIFSGDLCFPGGHIQKGETPLEAVLRQTQEETAINLAQKGRFLGFLNQTFVTKIGEKNKEIGRSFMGAMFFQIKEEVQIKLCDKQMRDYKWIPFERLINGSVNDLCYYNFDMKAFVQKSSKKKIEWVNYPAMNIGMQKVLWGYTFFITAAFIIELMKFYGVNRLRQDGFSVCEKYIQDYKTHIFSIRIKYEAREIEERHFQLSSKLQFFELKVKNLKPKL